MRKGRCKKFNGSIHFDISNVSYTSSSVCV